MRVHVHLLTNQSAVQQVCVQAEGLRLCSVLERIRRHQHPWPCQPPGSEDGVRTFTMPLMTLQYDCASFSGSRLKILSAWLSSFHVMGEAATWRGFTFFSFGPSDAG